MNGITDMALNRFAARIVTRSNGGSAVRAAAYIHGEKLRDERTGKLYDFTRKESRVEFSGVFVPKNAPEWMKDVGQLCNAIERREDESTRPDQAQLLREFIPTFPHEIDAERRRFMVTDFARELSRQGMVALVANHEPDEHSDERNYHAHILATMREVTPDGFGGKVREWNAKGQLVEKWKARWSELGAKQLERAGFAQEAERFRHGHKPREERLRLATERGDTDHADELRNAPNIHLGTAAASMERKGKPTERGDIYREIAEHNEQSATLREIEQRIEERQEYAEARNKGAELARGDEGRPMPNGLRGTPAAIWEAVQQSDSPKAIAAALADKGISLAVVTKEEAERSRDDAAAAREAGSAAPIYREQELVAVDRRAFVYRLTQWTTGTDFRDMQSYMRTLDRSALQGIDVTRQTMQTRQRESALKNATNIKSNHRQQGKESSQQQAAVLKRGGRKALSIAASVIGKAADIAGDLLAGPAIPKTRQQVEIAIEENRRIGNAVEKEAAAVHHWQAYTDEHEQIVARHEQQQRDAQQRDEQYRRLQRDRGEGRERER